jgi:uncharacterized protein
MAKRSSVIHVEHNASEARLGDLGVREWPIWTKEESTFAWSYDADETCYFLEGDVVVVPKGGTPVAMGQGDLVIFPQGMECAWEIRKAVRKHYRFG